MDDPPISDAAAPPEARWPRALPYVVMAAVCLAIHGFLLTNDGVIWDGWYFLSWLEHKNWGAFSDYAWSQGMPFSMLVLGPLAFFPDVITAAMVAILATLFLQGVVVYRLGLKLVAFTRSEALALAVLYQACPLVSAAQDFPIVTLLFFHLLFFAGGLAAATAMERSGRAHWVWRVGAIVALVMSCWTNGSLLMVYGSLYVALVVFYRRMAGLDWVQTLQRFPVRYPDLLLLPPFALWARNTFSPQFGWFEDYNKPTTDPKVIWETFASFFEHVAPYHLQRLLEWVVDHPALAILLAIFLVCWPRIARPQWKAERSGVRPMPLIGFALLAFLLGVLPLATIGKTFQFPPYGEFSRWSMHVPIPFAIVGLVVLRALCFRRRQSVSRWFPALAACAVVVFGSQILPVYVRERANWVISRAALHNMAKSELVRGSSVVIFRDRLNLCRQDVYGVYSSEMVFGDKTRMLVSVNPQNAVFMTPFETIMLLLPTALVPNEFNRINPAGQQTFVQPVLQRKDMSDWHLTWRYLRLKWFGSDAERDDFFGRLCPIEVRVQRPATPFPPDEPLPPAPDTANRPHAKNQAGVEMVKLKAGWSAGRFEVTQAQYETAMGRNPSIFKDPHRPVECVTWNEAMAFCDRLTEMERSAGRLPAGMVYRLPTHAEFQYLESACGADFVWDATSAVRWHTARVGSGAPNAFGLYDVRGNVWETCMDWWDRDERMKVANGGSWLNSPVHLTAYPNDPKQLPFLMRMLQTRLRGPYRRDYPDQAFWDRGFRVVLAPPMPKQTTYLRDREWWRE